MRGSPVRVLVVIASLSVVACGHAPPAPPAASGNPPPASPSAPIANHVAPAPAPAPPPAAGLRVTGIDPDHGDADGGTYVRITGSDFITDGARNVKVYFGAQQGTVVRFASDTELIVEAPGGKVGETVDVVVIFEPGGELKLPKAFTYVAKP